jgi:quercetin dioxygenase-like cupin family protein
VSPADRKVMTDALRFSLEEERARLGDPGLLERSGRNARTLVKNGPLRVVLIVVRAGGRIAPHRAAGPITVQVLDGDIRFHAAGREHRLAAGDLLVLDAGVEHDVDSDTGGTFLLTLLQLEQDQSTVQKA